MTYKQALEYKAKEDWDNYFLCLIKSKLKKANKELNFFNQKCDWKTKINFSKILPTIEKLVDKNNPGSQHLLGYMYQHGEGVEKDYEKAIHYYTLSANQGNSSAQYNLGNMYYFGQGVKKDYEKAIHYYTLSVNQENSVAQNNLGYMYKYGTGVEQDYEKAIHYYTLSANQGNSSAQNNLGNMYYSGQCVEQNYEKAIHYYTLSVNQGNSVASKNLEEIPKIKRIKYENKELRKENEELKTHIMAMPDGDLYFEAKKHYHDQVSTIK